MLNLSEIQLNYSYLDNVVGGKISNEKLKIDDYILISFNTFKDYIKYRWKLLSIGDAEGNPIDSSDILSLIAAYACVADCYNRDSDVQCGKAYFNWKFQANQVGTVTLNFGLVDCYDEDSDPIETETYKVCVEANDQNCNDKIDNNNQTIISPQDKVQANSES